MVVHAPHGHITVCPLVCTTVLVCGYLIAVGRLVPLSMFVCTPTEAWGDEAAEKNIFREAVKNGTVRSPTVHAVFVVYEHRIAIYS